MKFPQIVIFANNIYWNIFCKKKDLSKAKAKAKAEAEEKRMESQIVTVEYKITYSLTLCRNNSRVNANSLPSTT